MVRVLTQIGLVALGSAVGGVTRWGLGLAAARVFGTRFPVGTLVINVTGCFVLGWIATVLSERLVPPTSWLSSDDLRLLIAVGFCGGYTTFSTFGYEADRLFQDGEGLMSLLYLLASVCLGLVAVRLGVLVAKM